jgi:2,3-bisphosphoglycerate-independent phosphoglycerate mutase
VKLLSKGPTVLCILDGFGIGDLKSPHNAIALARTSCIDHLSLSYPATQILTSGLAIGLPDGQMGNSEVGHMTIGSGRIIEQNLTRINRHFKNKEIENLPVFKKIVNTKSTVHIIGLASQGGVHSHIKHITEIATLLSRNGLNVQIHAISDGRDTGQRYAVSILPQLQSMCANLQGVQLATICGRYYAMDRDNRHDRTKLAYDLYTQGTGRKTDNITETINDLYHDGIYDEFFPPILCDEFRGIKDGDTVVFANFRPDRMRQIVEAFVKADFSYFQRSTIYQKIAVFTMTAYFPKDQIPTFNIQVQPIFDNIIIADNLAATIAAHGYSQLHVAETEKYAHVTFFLNGGIEDKNTGEEWLLIPSPKVAHYDLNPEMAARQIGNAICDNIGRYDFVICNLANCDMVGHTGNLAATIKAVETVDQVLQQIFDATIKHNGTLMITADHGNAEIMIDHNNMPHTQHTNLPVPLIVANQNLNKNTPIQTGTLADIAPTLLTINSIPIPQGMTGKSLL